MLDLKNAIENLPDETWVCVADGPVSAIIVELGANEPFILIDAEPN